jgi:hypothetical protein
MRGRKIEKGKVGLIFFSLRPKKKKKKKKHNHKTLLQIETVLDEATAEAAKSEVSHLVSTIDIHFKIMRCVIVWGEGRGGGRWRRRMEEEGRRVGFFFRPTIHARSAPPPPPHSSHHTPRTPSNPPPPRPVPLHTSLEVEARVEKVAGVLRVSVCVVRPHPIPSPSIPLSLSLSRPTPPSLSSPSKHTTGVKATVSGCIRDPGTGTDLASCVAVLADLAALRRAGVGV